MANYCCGLFALSLGLAVASCAEPVIEPSGQIPLLYVDGFVDAERGVLLAAREPIPPDGAYNLDSLETAAPLGVKMRICSSSSEHACVPIPSVGPGRWRLADIPAEFSTGVAIEITVADVTYRVEGQLPRAEMIAYDSLSTQLIPEERDVRDIYEDAFEHAFALSTASDSLALIVAWPNIFSETGAGVFLTAGGAACGILNFTTDGYQSVTPNCRLSEGVELSAYQIADVSDTVRFFLTVTYDQEYPFYLESMRQENYNSGLSGLYDVLEVEGNVPGLGGYVLFGSSYEVVAVP